MAYWRGFSPTGINRMRKILIVAGLLLGAALLTGTPSKAELGCTCLKLGQPLACTAGLGACVLKGGGACVLPCDYTPAPAKAVKAKRSKKKMS